MAKQNIIKLCFVTYIISILIVTQLPMRNPLSIDYLILIKEILSLRIFEHVMYNFVPFNNINVLIETLQYSRNSQILIILMEYFKGFICNIILFIPLGVLLPAFISKYQHLIKLLIFSLLLSIGLEALQLVQQLLAITSWRVEDIEDVIANLIGALLGFFIHSYAQKKFNSSKMEKQLEV